MPLTIGWEGNDTVTVDYNPFAPKYKDPPTPPIYSYDSGYRRGGGVKRSYGATVTDTRKKWKPPEPEEEGLKNQIGYPTDWKYPNWLIRMAQWRNF